MSAKRNSLSLISTTYPGSSLRARLVLCSLEGFGFGFPNCFPQVTQRCVLISKASIRDFILYSYYTALRQYRSIESLDCHLQLLSISCPNRCFTVLRGSLVKFYRVPTLRKPRAWKLAGLTSRTPRNEVCGRHVLATQNRFLSWRAAAILGGRRLILSGYAINASSHRAMP